MSVRHPRSHTPGSPSETDGPIDWSTVADDELAPSPSDPIEVALAKIDEQTRRKKEGLIARRRQEEEEARRRKEEEDERRRKEEEDERRRKQEEQSRKEAEVARKLREEEEARARRMAEEAEEAENAKAAREVNDRAEDDEGDEATAVKSTGRAPSAGSTTPRIPGLRRHPCTLCLSTGEPCIDLPDSRSKQCAKCFRQKKGCRLPNEKVRQKRKDVQLSPRSGEKRKRTKIASEDDDNRFVGTSTTAAGEIASLLRSVVAKVDKLADPSGKGKSRAVVESAEEERDGDDDDSEAVSAEEFGIYMNYIRKPGFEESLDYDFLRELFTKVLKNAGESDDNIYDWMLLNNGKGWEANNIGRHVAAPAPLP
ncbi:hypothetical protein EV401DRAFT_2073223 [Pisolithus croceorrhizus]|nr:hypothetical protein EV401DRAFT_2073223 [Pisolithus croceorrhizus]